MTRRSWLGSAAAETLWPSGPWLRSSGNRFKLDRALRENFWLSGAPTASTLFPLFSGDNIADVAIESIAFDGNRANKENLDGNYAGSIFTQDCNRFTIRGVTARNYNGDGVSWQICDDFVVEDCHSHDNAGLGLHPGSGSQRPQIRRNRLERNDQGLFFCWGVKWGIAQKNTITGNRRFGISMGHRDTDNLVRDNDVRDSGEVGILFRKERGPGISRIATGSRTIASSASPGTPASGSTFSGRRATSRFAETRFRRRRRRRSGWACGSGRRRDRSRWRTTGSKDSRRQLKNGIRQQKSRQHGGNGEQPVRPCLGRHRLILRVGRHVAVYAAFRIPMHDQPPAVDVQHPVFGHARTGVQVTLHGEVGPGRRVGDFDGEHHFVPSRQTAAVFRRHCNEDRQVRLRQVSFPIREAYFHRRLAQDPAGAKGVGQHGHQYPNRPNMRRILTHLVNQISIDQFEALSGE